MLRLILTLLCSYFFLTATAQPTITLFSPAKAKPTDVVTITGTGFNTTPSNNILFFGATRATVTAANSTSLTVTVPTGATYDYISLLNIATGLSAQSKTKFHPTYSPAKTGITSSDFSSKVDFSTGSAPQDVAIGDLDGDGKPDLVSANRTSNTVSVFRNTSSSGSIASGSFATKVDFSLGSNPASVAIGDLNGDGKPDLAVANGDGISVFLNTSSGSSISFAAKVDFGNGTSISFGSVTIGDVDGDGKPDLVFTSPADYWVSVLRNISTAGSLDFAAEVHFIGGAVQEVHLGDLDGDGKPDLAVSNSDIGTSVFVFRNTSSVGSINFAPVIYIASGNQAISVALGDVDGDGKLDIATANQPDNNVSVLRNTSSVGNISFAAKVDFSAGTQPYSVKLGDLDGDGKLDIAVANQYSNNISVLRSTSSVGNISCAAKVDFLTGTTPTSVAVGDLDGDTKPDLVIANSASATLSVLRNTDSPLPVVLASFTATLQDAEAKIEWSTVTENDIETYEVQRSIDGKNFVTIINRKANNVNNSSYTVFDENLRHGTNWYRLFIRSKDGDNKYSNIVNVKFGAKDEGILVYPNPVANRELNLQLTAEKGKYNLKLIDNAGKTVWQTSLQHQGGSINESYTLPSIPKGVYTLQVNGAIEFIQKIIF